MTKNAMSAQLHYPSFDMYGDTRLRVGAERSLAQICPGLYCGRTALAGGNWSDCASCPRGFRPNSRSVCTICEDGISGYDWMYLAFMALLPLVLNLAIVDLIYRKARNRSFAVMVLLVVAECLLATIVTLSIFSDAGTIKVRSCGVSKLSDWYSIFHNPRPDHLSQLRCAQEVIYPLYSMVFVYLFFSLAFTLLLRGVVARVIWSHLATNSLLACLYQYPLLLVFHAALAGVIHVVFPYLAMVCSVISSTVHFTASLDNSSIDVMSVWSQWRRLLTNKHRLVVTFVHWLLLAFGIVSLLHAMPFRSAAWYAALIPCPTLVFLATLRFTEPKKFFSNFNR